MNNTFKFDYIIHMLKYEGIVREKIIQYKFNEQAYLYKTFAKFILNNKKICSFLKSYDIIMPVPINRKKYKQRGYNQTELITKEIAKELGIKTSKSNLIKIRDTKMQSTLMKVERKNNVKNAFEVLKSEELKNKRIILFDDIYTTGSTVCECSRILKKAGAKNILVLTIAKD